MKWTGFCQCVSNEINFVSDFESMERVFIEVLNELEICKFTKFA